MSEWKYIVFDTPVNGQVLVAFPPLVEHSMVKLLLNTEVVSAGFLHYNQSENKIFCSGKSTSLGVESRPEIDSRLASKFLDW